MKNGAVSYHSVIEAWMEPDTEHLSLLRLTQGSGSQITDHSSPIKKKSLLLYECSCLSFLPMVFTGTAWMGQGKIGGCLTHWLSLPVSLVPFLSFHLPCLTFPTPPGPGLLILFSCDYFDRFQRSMLPPPRADQFLIAFKKPVS